MTEVTNYLDLALKYLKSNKRKKYLKYTILAHIMMENYIQDIVKHPNSY